VDNTAACSASSTPDLQAESTKSKMEVRETPTRRAREGGTADRVSVCLFREHFSTRRAVQLESKSHKRRGQGGGNHTDERETRI